MARRKRRRSKVLGTIRRGKVKIRSKKQMGYLHHWKIDHTHYKYKHGKVVKKSRHSY